MPELEKLLGEMRPRLHRYCARMCGSVIDGEDIVQDALAKAYAARASFGGLDHPQAWLYRIAHNAALDFLRQRARLPPMEAEDELASLATPDAPDPEIAATCLRSFMRLPALQRSAVILKDVLGHSVGEAAAITGASEPAVKSALQRGRERLRAVAGEAAEPALPGVDGALGARLVAYVDGFKAGDFDGVRAMLAEDVRLELVTKLRRHGKSEVSDYYGAYAAAVRWAFAAALVEGRPAMLVFDREVSLDAPAYFVAFEFAGGQVAGIRDFLYARYAMDGVEIRPLLTPPGSTGACPTPQVP
ncbi:sigma-70 family RNA polymerase sigma factor [Duganella violaceipulchra]|uniref:RNA polymerase sigma-70 factor (ECF subfamily) n=1 Tax=Duganella violaceipulchra TaxID=2849652 RepID=A0AA41L4Q4_9BURK|nr:sigma-70 family RNA polymerase sigma factor [Duganella violaceicalia]MBV6323214.1 sigma-70 family RNA polymerase sigma factor [Duganella violaceicalia]MCP2009998.1 RNA polymerase sigma-70 factor (ECF subfamily) [Duganella violaceicalia]